MERDFLGLSLKGPVAVVEEEVNTDGFNSIGFSKVSGTEWSLSNQVSALPHYMLIKSAHEDKTRKIGSDLLASSPSVSVSTPDAYNLSRIQSISDIQKPFSHNRQGGNHISLSPMQHDEHFIYHPHDAKVSPAFNNVILVSASHPNKNHYATDVQNMVCTTMKPQVLGGIPASAPLSAPNLPTIGSVSGLAQSCANASGSPAQLTIFYAGTVNVYDDISPEKAQAIMFMAGNGTSISSTVSQPKVPVHSASPKEAVAEVSPLNNPLAATPCSHTSSPLSVSSHPTAQSGSGSISTEEIKEYKTTAIETSPPSKLELPTASNSIRSVALPPTMIPSVPQARKASLARFLEKRKERVMNAMPYNNGKKFSDASQESSATNCSATSATGTGSLTEKRGK